MQESGLMVDRILILRKLSNLEAYLIDSEIVIGILRKRLSDFGLFKDAVVAFLR